ncbi:hypothetical protein NLM33_06245 [Bradyrhizobium sp. CCGUVB1N3]|uniref:hypothetical protein n=1 Tax=Bradyrhizobium sp. CCGUVB1N3 TaxID=2949629 RepID=UPI0020B3E1C5|nr:hypothetical protein [Bradyrhizobium sp. CCGUVB1N3]MCP3469928.1 hypothetical protein [Bradyrhizobium sp. CCGUVB1N3]
MSTVKTAAALFLAGTISLVSAPASAAPLSSLSGLAKSTENTVQIRWGGGWHGGGFGWGGRGWGVGAGLLAGGLIAGALAAPYYGGGYYDPYYSYGYAYRDPGYGDPYYGGGYGYPPAYPPPPRFYRSPYGGPY